MKNIQFIVTLCLCFLFTTGCEIQSLFDSKPSNPIASDNVKEIQKTKEDLSKQILQDIPMRPHSHGYAVYCDGWIYLQQGCTYRMRPDGTQREFLNDLFGNFMMVIPEGIFLLNRDIADEFNIFRMDHDGSNCTKLNSQFTMEYFDIDRGWIYYKAPPHFGNDTGPHFSLYRMKLDGSNKEELVKNALVRDFDLYQDWVYYNTDSKKTGDNELWRMHRDGTNAQLIYTHVSYFHFDAMKNWIYITSERFGTEDNTNREKYGRIRPDGTQYEGGIREDTTMGFLVNGWDFYIVNSKTKSIHARLVEEVVSMKICDYPEAIDRNHVNIDIAGGYLFLRFLFSGPTGYRTAYYKMYRVPLSGGECVYMEPLRDKKPWKIPDEI